MRECDAVKNCLFCYRLSAKKYYAFNKKIKKERFRELHNRIMDFNWHPNFNNFSDIKGDKEWSEVCIPQIKEVDDAEAWGKMPGEMLEYIKGLPEFDAEVFKQVTGIEA